jgi:eukaryotic-like serine/threonine-protein kinase
MAAATQSVASYCTLITRSRLMTPEQVKNAYRQWQEAAGRDGDIESLRKYMVSQKHLTDYQSHLLMRGHTEGYFVDDYKILEMLSKGRMTGVYKAVHASGQVVDIKVLPPSKAKDPKLLSRFQREGRLLTRVDHPNVIRSFQIGESGGRHYLVLEHYDNETLDEVLEKRKRLPPPEAVRIVYQALAGLQHVFEKGMIHRDLRPSNFALTPPPGDGPADTTIYSTVKILDLGLGRTTFDESTGAAEPDTHLTSEGSLLGQPDYLAPEQARNAHESDIRADIYSVGCILYHLLTGQVPFPDPNVLTQIVKHATENARPLNQFLPQVPEGLQQALNWMMAKDPNQRYPTPARAAQALQMFMPPMLEEPLVSAPLPAYLQYLQAAGFMEAPKQAPAPPKPAPPPAIEPQLPGVPSIPVGRIEPEGKKRERKKDGTGPKPKLGAPVPAAATMPQAPYTSMEEYDVEVVATAPPPMAPPPLPLKAAADDRSLFDLDRRDWIMAGAGAAIMAVALLMGYGISRALRTPPAPTVEEQPAPKEPAPSQPYRRPVEKKEEPKSEPETPKKEEPKKDAGTEETKKDDPKKDYAKKDDPKKDDAKKDDPAKTDPKKDDAKKDDAKKDDPAKTDPKKDDAKKPDPKKDDAKKDASE